MWMADTSYSGGSSISTSRTINGATPALYQTARSNANLIKYQFAVSNGNYSVTLKFAELVYRNKGKRIFNTALNGVTVLSNFDVFDAAGGAFRAVDRQFSAAVSNGQISIVLNSVVGDPIVSAIDISPNPSSPIRINAGGAAYTDALGQLWAADTGFTSGYVYVGGNTVAGTSDNDLYRSQRWNDAPFAYQFAAPNGNYLVTLGFAELYYSSIGQRVFNIMINNQSVVSNLDILGTVGKNTVLLKSFPVTVTGGSINIQYLPVAGQPVVNTIEILPQ